MKIHVYTLGCKVNQFESQAMEAILKEHGHEVTENDENCDAVILNTCAVTAESARKSRQMVRRMRERNPDAIIGICGCWPQSDPDAAASMGDVIYGNGDHEKFIEDLEARHATVNVNAALSRRAFEELPSGNVSSRTRALLKIEDGCVNFCAYCIIPYVRGPIRSLTLEAIAREAERLQTEMFREIVLTGIEIASYGRDFKENITLSDAVQTAANSAPETRIRLGSLEPRVVTAEFCDRLSECPNICPHFHLSLQSGCDETLRRMRRKYDTARFYESVELLRSYYPNCGITADIIVGFPGETEEEFAMTLGFAEKCAFSAIHIFPYSIRPGTAAEHMPDQVEKAVKRERAARMSRVAGKTREAFLKKQLGLEMPVLFESEAAPGVWEGHTGNYVLVRAKGDNLHNCLSNVRITTLENGILSGELTL